MDISQISTGIWIAIAIALVLGILALAKVKKGQKVLGVNRTFFAWVFILGGAFLFAWQGGLLVGLGLPLSAGVTSGGTQPLASATGQNINVVGCNLGTQTTVTLSGKDAYNSSASGGTHAYMVSSDGGKTFGPVSTVSDAGTLTASPGQILDILWGNGATKGYFSAISQNPIPCTGAVTFTQPLYTNGSFSSTVFNTNGQVIDGVTANQTLGAGDIKDLSLKIIGTYQKATPYGWVAVVEYNKTDITQVKLMDSSGNLLPTASLPNSFTSGFAQGVATTSVYLIPGQFTSNDLNLKVELTASQTINPANGNTTITYFPLNDYKDTGTGLFAGPSAVTNTNTVTMDGGSTTVVYYQ